MNAVKINIDKERSVTMEKRGNLYKIWYENKGVKTDIILTQEAIQATQILTLDLLIAESKSEASHD